MIEAIEQGGDPDAFARGPAASPMSEGYSYHHQWWMAHLGLTELTMLSVTLVSISIFSQRHNLWSLSLPPIPYPHPMAKNFTVHLPRSHLWQKH